MCRSLFRTKDILKLSSEEATTFNFLTKKVYRSHSVMRNTTSCNRIKHNKPRPGRLNFRIPGHIFACHWITIVSFVFIWLVLQSIERYVDKWPGILKSLREQLIKTTFSRLTDDQIWSNLTKNNTQALSHKISEKDRYELEIKVLKMRRLTL